MRSIAVAVALVLTAGCGKDTQVAERVAAWQGKIAAEIPTGTTRAEVNRWAIGHGFPPTKGNEPEFVARVETIKGDGIVCSEWHVLVSVRIVRGRVTQAQVSQAGTCL